LQLQQANRLLNHANDELSLARERASEVDTMKRAFIDMISHEIRTPLTAIHGYSDIFLMELTDNDHRDFAERIRASSKHLLLLFEDMLHLSKMRGDQINLDLELVSIHEVCRQIIAMFESVTQEKGIVLKLEVSSSLVQHLLLDTAKVRLIIFNLVGNAVKFTEKGGVTLSVAPIPNPQESEITAETGMMTGICITVHDTGIGMPEEALKHIFESFRQTNVDIHRKYGGLGLGLTICKAFADAMGGSITAESVQGEGSTFRVIIPISYKEISNAQ
jgi:signal transduction histidine kinase